VLVLRRQVSLVVQEKAHHLQVAPARSLVQAGVSELVHHPHIRPSLQQQLHHGQVVVHRRVVERGASVLRAQESQTSEGEWWGEQAHPILAVDRAAGV
jgi:hypothetical protein